MLHLNSSFLALNNANGSLIRSNLVKKFIPNSFHLIHTSACHKQEPKSHTQTILVYEGPLKTRIKRVKLLSLTSSMMGFAILPVVIKDLSQTSIALSCGVVLFSSFFLSTPLLLDWITKRYVMQLHYDSSTQLFTATTVNLICQQQELQFSADDVTVPDLPGLLTSFEVKGRPLFVDANQVKDPEAYSLMMGYDKPLDLKLSSEEKKENVS
ncbi:Transmembrane protein 70, mitochondrial [Araneus ventricosus]|uniref:Transmembrane protein 70, mitochondrial n=1 Tax=Araneus ventricosus TaxID=182803 RepID=A0A4Y2S8S7_ARAVE|nr:Transmembrane protein 70, mitochondrial [Araneus ventricosus]